TICRPLRDEWQRRGPPMRDRTVNASFVYTIIQRCSVKARPQPGGRCRSRRANMVEYAPRGLIGLLTPHANTTLEPEFFILMSPGYAFLNARLVSDKPT